MFDTTSMKRLSFFFLTMLAAATAGAQQTYTYTLRGAAELKLDVYQPATPRADKACVVYLFGGAFMKGSRDGQEAVRTCRLLADRGFVAVSADYRLYLADSTVREMGHHTPVLKMHNFFDTAISWAVQDCSAAIAWLCDNAETLHIDTSKIILTGNSAGAIAVASLDYGRCNALPDVSALPAGFRPAAVLPFAGAIHCRNSRLEYATPPAPTCFVHGKMDHIVTYKRLRSSFSTSLFGSSKLAKLFKRNGYCYWMVRVEGRGHEVSEAHTSLMDEFCAFVDTALAGHFMQYDMTVRNEFIPDEVWGKASLFSFL